jgi:aminopeptidase YwaD
VLQTFPVQTYVDRGSRVEVVSGTGSESLEADTLGYSIAGDVQAPLIAAGLGQASDFEGLDARDKVVLVKRGTLRFSEKVANAAAAGAKAVIVYNESPGRVQGSLVQPEALPAVTVSAESGQRLLDLLTGGSPTLHVVVDAATEQRNGTNVLAELPGDRAAAGTVIFGGHLDSVAAGPGANDNGSGSAVVLELARELAQRPLGQRPLNVRFALFGAEELGLFGSRAYVDALSDADRQSILAMVNLDMVGVGDLWHFGGTEDLVQRALGTANDLGARSAPMRGSLAGASDHASFLAAGIPAVFLYRAEDPNYHTANDRPEFVDPVALGQAGTIALSILDGLASEHQ